MSYDNIRLEKGMYGICNKDFTSVLEELDPSENYHGTELENLDAYQRQLKRFNIKVHGAACDSVEKFFCATDSAVLFPEFIARAVRAGLAKSDILSSIVAARTITDATDYRPISSTTAELGQGETSAVGEGENLRSVSITMKPSLVSLTKHGRALSTSYEALRFQNLEVFSVILQKIGQDIATEQFEDAFVAINDGIGEIEASTNHTLTYSKILQLWSGLAPYNFNTILASYSIANGIISLSEISDKITNKNGTIELPMGISLIPAAINEGYSIIGLDKNCTLQMIQCGGVKIDYDKVIDCQLEKTAISVTAGFSKLFGSAAKKLSY